MLVHVVKILAINDVNDDAYLDYNINHIYAHDVNLLLRMEKVDHYIFIMLRLYCMMLENLIDSFNHRGDCIDVGG